MAANDTFTQLNPATRPGGSLMDESKLSSDAFAAWAQSTPYAIGDVATANGNVYACTTAGTSSASGAGPSSTATSIPDGSVVWKFVRTGATVSRTRVALGAFDNEDALEVDRADSPSGQARLATVDRLAIAKLEAIRATLDDGIEVTLALVKAAIDSAVDVLNDVHARLADGTQKTQVTNFPASQPVTGPLTDTQLRATPVLVSGTVSTGGLTDVELRATPIAVVQTGPVIAELVRHEDVFGNLVTGQRDNQLEVHYDDAAWASYLSTTQTGGGGATQHEGHVHFTTSTGANGRSKAVSIDVVKYRPLHEVYWGFTACWTAPGIANSYALIGAGDDINGIRIGYVGAQLALVYMRGTVDISTLLGTPEASITVVPRASWTDQLDGSPSSAFTRNGVAEAWSPTLTNVFRVRVGLLGSAPLVFEVLSPDNEWVEIYQLKRPNVSSEPTFTNFDLPITVEVRKSGAGATDLEIRSACWAGGTTSDKGRLSDPITDRSLAGTVRAVLECRTNAGSYAKVLVNAQGRLQVINDSVDVVGSATPLSATLVGGTDGTSMRAVSVDVDGRLQVGLGALTGWQSSQIAVDTSVVQVASSPLSNRKTISLKALCYVDSLGTSDVIYIGNGVGVTTTTGYGLANGESIDLDLDDAATIYAIGSASRIPSNGLYVVEIA